MKDKIIKNILVPFLGWCTRRIIKKHRPKIIGITGSVGKSSTKEMVYHVLKDRLSVRRSPGNLNNELGVPLTVIGESNPQGDILEWLKIIGRGIKLSFIKSKEYPKILILEMGVDRPGDMRYLLSIASCDIGIITNIGVTHLQFFHNVKNILKEKSELVKKLPEDGLAILNYDNFFLRLLKKSSKKPCLTFGLKPRADVKASDVKIGYTKGVGEGMSLAKGTNFKINYKTVFLPVHMPHIISSGQVYAALAAATVGLHLKMNLVEIADSLKKYKPLPGRMRLLGGKGGNIIIDDTYNSAPNSVKSALEVLVLVKSKKKTVILGDMLELGKIEKSAHKEMAKLVYPVANKVVLVGKRTLNTHKELRRLGFPKDKIFHFRMVTSLIKKLPSIVGKGEVILIKGSQGVRLEKAAEKLVKSPRSAQKNLVRQSKYWKRKPVIEV